MLIYTDENAYNIGDSITDLAFAMRFKQYNIKAKADPEIFGAVAAVLENIRMARMENGVLYIPMANESTCKVGYIPKENEITFSQLEIEWEENGDECRSKDGRVEISKVAEAEELYEIRIDGVTYHVVGKEDAKKLAGKIARSIDTVKVSELFSCIFK